MKVTFDTVLRAAVLVACAIGAASVQAQSAPEKSKKATRVETEGGGIFVIQESNDDQKAPAPPKAPKPPKPPKAAKAPKPPHPPVDDDDGDEAPKHGLTIMGGDGQAKVFNFKLGEGQFKLDGANVLLRKGDADECDECDECDDGECCDGGTCDACEKEDGAKQKHDGKHAKGGKEGKPGKDGKNKVVRTIHLGNGTVVTVTIETNGKGALGHGQGPGRMMGMLGGRMPGGPPEMMDHPRARDIEGDGPGIGDGRGAPGIRARIMRREGDLGSDDIRGRVRTEIRGAMDGVRRAIDEGRQEVQRALREVHRQGGEAPAPKFEIVEGHPVMPPHPAIALKPAMPGHPGLAHPAPEARQEGGRDDGIRKELDELRREMKNLERAVQDIRRRLEGRDEKLMK